MINFVDEKKTQEVIPVKTRSMFIVVSLVIIIANIGFLVTVFTISWVREKQIEAAVKDEAKLTAQITTMADNERFIKKLTAQANAYNEYVKNRGDAAGYGERAIDNTTTIKKWNYDVNRVQLIGIETDNETAGKDYSVYLSGKFGQVQLETSEWNDTNKKWISIFSMKGLKK